MACQAARGAASRGRTTPCPQGSPCSQSLASVGAPSAPKRSFSFSSETSSAAQQPPPPSITPSLTPGSGAAAVACMSLPCCITRSLTPGSGAAAAWISHSQQRVSLFRLLLHTALAAHANGLQHAVQKASLPMLLLSAAAAFATKYCGKLSQFCKIDPV